MKLKKSFVIFPVLMVLCFLLFGCKNPTLYNVLVRNESTKVVSYRYADRDDSLSPGEDRGYDVTTGTEAPHHIETDGGNVIMVYARGDVYTFIDELIDEFIDE